MTSPKNIWAWSWNYPNTKWHGTKTWTDFKPKIDPLPQTFVSTSAWNPFKGYVQECKQDVEEYIRSDLHIEKVFNLIATLEDARQALVDANEELIELRSTLSKQEVESFYIGNTIKAITKTIEEAKQQ